ncbi:DYNLL [Lepeophtheirus salmonis]|uniref:Dynein light chain n=1 Tax=Lepeophtheirus salmonis TaxID=72036 RepID=A0A7R8CIR0_LEPSM|nr:DYNLL [Lepeophtheirus salmonis]CAF2829079.1 DYNLL [Lepeophtheirus salmonis]
MTDRKAVIKNADMAEELQQDAVDCATQALEKYNIEKDIAAYIKKEFDKKYNPTWGIVSLVEILVVMSLTRRGISSTFTLAKLLFSYLNPDKKFPMNYHY